MRRRTTCQLAAVQELGELLFFISREHPESLTHCEVQTIQGSFVTSAHFETF